VLPLANVPPLDTGLFLIYAGVVVTTSIVLAVVTRGRLGSSTVE
jgi:hypothetical protein